MRKVLSQNPVNRKLALRTKLQVLLEKLSEFVIITDRSVLKIKNKRDTFTYSIKLN